MPGLKIICIGSPFGDDQFGAWAYGELRALIDPKLAELVYLDRPGTRLISAFESVDHVILIDAVKSGASPGTVQRIEGAEIYRYLARHTSTHGFGVADALKLAESLGMLPQRICLLGVEIDESEALGPLCAAMHSSLPTLLQALRDHTGLSLALNCQHSI